VKKIIINFKLEIVVVATLLTTLQAEFRFVDIWQFNDLQYIAAVCRLEFATFRVYVTKTKWMAVSSGPSILKMGS